MLAMTVTLGRFEWRLRVEQRVRVESGATSSARGICHCARKPRHPPVARLATYVPSNYRIDTDIGAGGASSAIAGRRTQRIRIGVLCGGGHRR